MTKNPTLSGEEISALMHELRDQEPRGGRPPGTARPFAFGNEASRPMSAHRRGPRPSAMCEQNASPRGSA